MMAIWLAVAVDAVIAILAVLFTPVSVPVFVCLMVLVAIVQITAYMVTHVSK